MAEEMVKIKKGKAKATVPKSAYEKVWKGKDWQLDQETSASTSSTTSSTTTK